MFLDAKPPISNSAEHWFDHATKAFARKRLGRREALKSLTLTGIAFLLSGTSCAQSLLGEARKIQPSPAPVPCTRTNVGGKRTTTVSASTHYKGKPLTLMSISTLSGHRTLSGTIYQRIQLGGKLLSELTYDFMTGFEQTSPTGISGTAIPPGRLKISYAPPITGPRFVLLKADSKGVIQGFSDGHLVTKEHPPVVTSNPILKSRCRSLLRARAAIWITV